MEIYDIIVESPQSNLVIIFDDIFFSYMIFASSLIIIILITVYHRRFISINTLNYISVMMKSNQISFKQFAFLLAQILCYKHNISQITRKIPPEQTAKKYHYIWLSLVDALDEIRYGKAVTHSHSHIKLYKLALEWLRRS